MCVDAKVAWNVSGRAEMKEPCAECVVKLNVILNTDVKALLSYNVFLPEEAY